MLMVIRGSTLSIGWVHDRYVNFVLAGVQGNYTGTNLDAPNWMKNNLGLLKGKKLKEICIAGSHDSGMSARGTGTAGAFDCNTLTQSRDVGHQLKLGVRYFDIRPVISSGGFYTGHYGKVGSSWQGANGQSIQSIISDVNAFAGSHNELVVLNFSHSLNTDVGNSSYRPFDQSEWNRLFNSLDGLGNLYVADKDSDLTDFELGRFVDGRAAVLVIVEEGGIDFGGRLGKGFYKYNSFNVYNKYSDTNDLNTMVEDQVKKMRESSDRQYFLLSWTLTQDGVQAATCALGTAYSIIDLAKIASGVLADRLYPKISPTSYPNIIYVDNVDRSDAAAMAMAVNWSVLS
ncbi:hypothetical protein [Pseudomonas purpurea]|uniref:hypothetical protein n=1 Tax=Pseudomonas purpurea TaxID=3136737 RepID=UPI003266D36D